MFRFPVQDEESSQNVQDEPLCMPVFKRVLGKITSIKKWDYQNDEDMHKAIYSVKREIAAIQVQMELLKSRTEDLEKKQELMLEERGKQQNKKKSWYEDCVDLFDYR